MLSAPDAPGMQLGSVRSLMMVGETLFAMYDYVNKKSTNL